MRTLILSLILSFSSQVYCMTLPEILQRSKWLIGEKSLTNEEIHALINEGNSYVLENDFIKKKLSVTMKEGATEYVFPMAYKRIDKVLKNETETSNYSILKTTAPRICFPDTKEKEIEIEYIPIANILNNTDDEPFWGDPKFKDFHDTLIKYVAYRYYESIDSIALSLVYKDQVDSNIEKMRLLK